MFYVKTVLPPWEKKRLFIKMLFVWLQWTIEYVSTTTLLLPGSKAGGLKFFLWTSEIPDTLRSSSKTLDYSAS